MKHWYILSLLVKSSFIYTTGCLWFYYYTNKHSNPCIAFSFATSQTFLYNVQLNVYCCFACVAHILCYCGPGRASYCIQVVDTTLTWMSDYLYSHDAHMDCFYYRDSSCCHLYDDRWIPVDHHRQPCAQCHRDGD